MSDGLTPLEALALSIAIEKGAPLSSRRPAEIIVADARSLLAFAGDSPLRARALRLAVPACADVAETLACARSFAPFLELQDAPCD